MRRLIHKMVTVAVKEGILMVAYETIKRYAGMIGCADEVDRYLKEKYDLEMDKI